MTADRVPAIEQVRRSLELRHIADLHPELFHYTSVGALESILETNEIWAFSAFHQNDCTEMREFWNGLRRPMFNAALGAYNHKGEVDPREREINEKLGGAELRTLVKACLWVRHARNALLSDQDDQAMMRPFIACFSTHSNQTEVDGYRRKHGMLSQWRAYAVDGVAIVFDTQGLYDLTLRDYDLDAYGFGVFRSVVYGGSNPFLNRLRSYYGEVLAQEIFQGLGSAQAKFIEGADYLVQAAVLTKHIGFVEKNECRLVMTVPTSNHVRDLTANGQPPAEELKKIRSLKQRPYIRIFENQDAPLPIKRVIVGPSRRQSEIAATSKELLATDFQSLSRTHPTFRQTMSSNPARRHHYVPQFYLRRWAVKGELHGYYWDSYSNSLRVKRLGTKAFCSEVDLLSLESPNVAADALETQFFGAIDNEGAEVVEKLLERGLRALSERDRIDFARLLMSMVTRQPAVIERLRNEGARTFREGLDNDREIWEALQANGVNQSPSEFWLASGNAPFEDRSLLIAQRLSDNPVVGNRIINSEWQVTRLGNRDGTFVLGDRPVVRVGDYRDPKCLWAIPLSPQDAFFASKSPDVMKALKRYTKNQIRKRLNVETVNQANCYVYMIDGANRPLVESRFEKRFRRL